MIEIRRRKLECIKSPMVSGPRVNMCKESVVGPCDFTSS